MTDQVKSATDAIRIARKAASEAGLLFNVVSAARKEGDKWIVEVTSVQGVFEAKIASASGEITEWKPTIDHRRNPEIGITR